MRRGLWIVVSLGAFGCSPLKMSLSPDTATIATSSWLEITVAAAPHCSSSTVTGCRTVASGGDAPDIVRVDVDAEVFRVDESLGTNHTAMLYALREGETEVVVTGSRDGDEDSAVGTYTIVDPDAVTVTPDCTGDDSAPVVAQTSVPLEVRIQRDDGAPLGGRGYDGLEATAGEIQVRIVEGVTEYSFVAPATPGPTTIASPHGARRPLTLSVVGRDELDGLEVSTAVGAPGPGGCSAAIGTRTTLGGSRPCVDAVPRTFTILTPETCEFMYEDGIELTGQPGSTHVEGPAAGLCRVRVQVEGTELRQDVELELCTPSP